jgi:type IV secretory pathway TrbD component
VLTVSPLLRHSLLTLPLEAKLTLVTISPTIATTKLYGLRLRIRLGMGLLIWFFSTRLLDRFLLTRLLTVFPKNRFPKVLLNLIGFWKSSVE